MPHSTDILILGAGLAGLRAAWAAAQNAPNRRVTLATLLPGPSGSSFANGNGQLGMQLPLSDRERETYVREAVALAAPGMIRKPLARIVAEEAEARFQELAALGCTFLRDAQGQVLRRTACFSPHARAAILDELRSAHARLLGRAESLGVELLTGAETVSLLAENGKVVGARLRDDRTLRAQAVVVALGGPAPLQPRHMAGPGNPGRGWEMLAAAGARMENTDYLQYMWLTVPGREFRSPADMAGADAVALTPDGREVAPSAKVLTLADARRSHCPAAWGPIPFQGEAAHDYGMDQWLQAMADEHGVVRVKLGSGPWEQIALFAHAGNGGALVDAHGAVLAADTDTPLPGLFACGECATGMHGANRLGGGMVAAALVFGKRAGEEAARGIR